MTTYAHCASKSVVSLSMFSWWRCDLCGRQDWPVLEDGLKADTADVDTSGNYDVTDSYLVARYSWHQDILKSVANNEAAKAR